MGSAFTVTFRFLPLCDSFGTQYCSGSREAVAILIAGLKRLEYRGYDSAGVALITNDNPPKLRVVKKQVRPLEAVRPLFCILS